ncbi:enoyl-CoA hydratase-related protein [Hydrogenibacillus sp. N12]|uniref:enoyl-CoA hydratase-related protein n=1 Tax=Hydrogenibacillus sp. N12 TaxID=2866627 RepID=UPI001C7D7B74|nr:enoyl-CoA hydratase-related protein [Hydrogenibacillus sp. N12]QZA34075.1 enoyl-CoA hydratase/isomerase family protein [Hydrogenibacillus sp. N12]
MTVRLESEGPLAVVVLDRPEALNAFDYATLLRLGDIAAELGRRSEIHVVLFRGEGRAFSVGADLKERRTLTEAEVRRNVETIQRVFHAVARLPQPTIAVLHGYAFGGGFELALACDFRFAAPGTVMGLTETSLGIIPGAGGTQRLARLVGPMRAKELIFTARRITAEEALRLGILTGVADDPLSAARALAAAIADNAPLAVRAAKFAIDRGLEVDLESGLALETKAYETLIPTRDRREALEAFAEKRKPRFTGE